jgi:hypothetical protein
LLTKRAFSLQAGTGGRAPGSRRERKGGMAAPPARARADYDYLIKLLLIGDSGGCC